MGNRALRILLRVVLAVSLIANAAMIGLLLRLGAIRDEMGFERAAVAPEIRREFLARAPEDETLRQAVQNLGTARATLMDLLENAPLDTAAIEAQMAEVRSATEALQTEAHRILLEAAQAAD